MSDDDYYSSDDNLGFGLFGGDDTTSSSEDSLDEEEDYAEDLTGGQSSSVNSKISLPTGKVLKILCKSQNEKSMYFTDSLFFMEERRVIVSCSDGNIRIYNYDTLNQTNIIRKVHEKHITGLVKINPKCFLSYGNDGKIVSYSNKRRIIFWDRDRSINLVLKIDASRLLVVATDNVSSTKEFLVVRNREDIDMNHIDKSITCLDNLKPKNDINKSLNSVKLSKTSQESHVWIKFSSFGVVLVDIREDKICYMAKNEEIRKSIRSFNRISHFDTFLNSKGEEILLVGGDNYVDCSILVIYPKKMITKTQDSEEEEEDDGDEDDDDEDNFVESLLGSFFPKNSEDSKPSQLHIERIILKTNKRQSFRLDSSFVFEGPQLSNKVRFLICSSSSNGYLHIFQISHLGEQETETEKNEVKKIFEKRTIRLSPDSLRGKTRLIGRSYGNRILQFLVPTFREVSFFEIQNIPFVNPRNILQMEHYQKDCVERAMFVVEEMCSGNQEGVLRVQCIGNAFSLPSFFYLL